MDIDPIRRNKKPRLLLESERERLDEFIDSIHYSARYSDDKYEYRHVQLPKNMLKKIPADYFDSAKGTLKLLWEEEWRALGITQSLGWEHYEATFELPATNGTIEVVKSVAEQMDIVASPLPEKQ
ncbi:Cyclin-dependent kinase regulatory subunit [Penicillium angulare]|uniref:Cyclin-dependent kinases regulatory subunit n=1 Tax=Penicillium angulare TaxID=116970 RepID=A0A9W9EUF7_9EURO|nr:Cyclin-dependent kinase regulatory subunit [Penicillium angulare]